LKDFLFEWGKVGTSKMNDRSDWRGAVAVPRSDSEPDIWRSAVGLVLSMSEREE